MIHQHRFNVMPDRQIRQAEIAPMDAIAWAPRSISLRGVLVSLLICAFLFGLLVVGK